MNIYLLDAGGLFYIAIFAGILFLLVAVLVEALIMKLMKYNLFGKAFLHSLLVNIISAVAGYLLMDTAFDSETLVGLAGLFLITLIIEGIGLYLLNNKYPVGKTFKVTLVMNLVTYSFLVFIYIWQNT